jgi:hypothetical protein
VCDSPLLSGFSCRTGRWESSDGHERVGVCGMGGRGCRGLHFGGQLVWPGGGISITLALLHPRLAACLFRNRAVVLLLSFACGKLMSAQLALLVWLALGCLIGGFPAFLPCCACPFLCKTLLLLLGLSCYPCALCKVKEGLMALLIKKL